MLLILFIGFAVLISAQQPVSLEFYAEGPGAVVVRCPPPYITGQGLILNAQPLANARFVAWDDGSTALERFLIVSTNSTQFTAFFADVNAATYQSILGWSNLDVVSGFSGVQYPVVSGRTLLSFAVDIRRSYQVFQTTNLSVGYFSQVPFALSATGPVSAMQRTAEAGPVNVWVLPPANSAPAYYRVRLDGVSNYPSLFFAQATKALPGATIMLYGEGLTGTPIAWAGSNAISATSLGDNVLRVTLPSSPGSNFITAAINGFLALGGIPINISTNTSQVPVVSSVSLLPSEGGGLLQVSGSNLTAQFSFFLDGIPVTIVRVSPDGTTAVLSVPTRLGGSRQLTAVNNGFVSSPLSVTLRQSSFAYSPATTRGAKMYAWAPYQPNTFGYTPATTAGLRVYSWAPNQPGSFSFVPTTKGGVSLYSWQSYRPNAYAYSPSVTKGVEVYAWAAYQPGAYSYMPATTRGVRVYSP